MSGLRGLGRDQDRALQSLLASPDAHLLSRLTQSECLLALARLSAVRADVVTYAGTVVGVVTQFIPCRACRIWLEVADVPTVDVRYGEADVDDDGWQRHPLLVGDTGVGELALVAEVGELASDEFVAAISEQVSASLDMLIEAERLRRQAAVSEAMHLAEALADDASPDDVARLVDALAVLPRAVGARLDIVHPSVGGAVRMEAGAAPQGGTEPIDVPGGHLAVAVRWSSGVEDRDRASLTEVIGVIVRSLAKAEERRKLRLEAETDALTGVGNRRRAGRMLASAAAFAERSAGTVGVLYLDLDHFKRVNDTCGHDVGDRVLSRFGAHLAGTVRSYDTVARYGGEEFLVISPGLDGAGGLALARRILETTPAACADLLPEGWRQTVSVGLACYPDAADNVEGVLQAADRALYLAKQGGRDQVRMASAALDQVQR